MAIRNDHSSNGRTTARRYAQVTLAVGSLCLSGCALWPITERDAAGSAAVLDGSRHVTTALQQYQAGELERALESVRKARAKDPGLEAAWELESLILADLGQSETTVETLRAILRAHSNSAHLHARVGQRLVRAGGRDEGLAAMRRAVQLDPRRTQYVRDLASVLVDVGDTRQATAVLMAALERNPGDLELPIAIARLCEAAGNWSPALEYYSAALRHQPENVMLRRQRARCLYRLHEFPAAEAEFQRCLEQDVHTLTVADRIEFGDACLRNGNLDRAIWLFDGIAATGVATREVETLRGVCELRRGRASVAAQIFASALSRWPDDPKLALLLETSRQSSSGVQTVGGTLPVVDGRSHAAIR
jgi:tetratricopeptide (TPR) repeat protein